MPHPLVVHCKKTKDFDVYVGRKSRGAPSGGTGEWGNPFAMKNASDAERRRVILAYEAWLTPAMRLKAKKELKGKRLACWCAPKPCHADVLARIANEDDEEEEEDEQEETKQDPPPAAATVEESKDCFTATVLTGGSRGRASGRRKAPKKLQRAADGTTSSQDSGKRSNSKSARRSDSARGGRESQGSREE